MHPHGGRRHRGEYVDLLLSQHVSGIVFVGGHYTERYAPHDHYQLLVERRMPVVLINAAIEGLPFPRVSCDDGYAVEQALGHVVSLGHERIGLVLGPEDHVPVRTQAPVRAAGARAAGQAAPAQRVARSSYSLESGQAAAARLLKAGVTGIVCASDPLALGAIRAVRRPGSTCRGTSRWSASTTRL